MSAARLGAKHCVYCCRPESEVGRLSVRGNCRECGIEACVSAAIQQSAKSGPVYERAVTRRRDQAIREASRIGAPQAA